jgi:pyridoxamine 5'-phosphate oxidase
LERKWDEAEKEFAGREIPCPAHWGGYLLQPKTIEFWIGQPGRLHDRFLYEKSGTSWTFRRLYP